MLRDYGGTELNLDRVVIRMEEENPVTEKKRRLREDFGHIVERDVDMDKLMEIPLEDVLRMAENIDSMIEEHFGGGHIHNIMRTLLKCRMVRGRRRLL